jgi:hypothetical protein
VIALAIIAEIQAERLDRTVHVAQRELFDSPEAHQDCRRFPQPTRTEGQSRYRCIPERQKKHNP